MTVLEMPYALLNVLCRRAGLYMPKVIDCASRYILTNLETTVNYYKMQTYWLIM